MNKKGFIGITITLGMIIVIAVLIALLVGGIGLFLSKNLLPLIGGTMILLTLIFGLREKLDRTKGIFMFIFVVLGIFLIMFSGQISQNITTPTGTYIEAPTFFYYECAPTSAPLKSNDVPLTSGSSDGWIMCPDNTDQCDLFIYQTETAKWFATDRRIIYQKCDANWNCDPQVSTPAIDFFSKNQVPTVQIPNLLSTDRVWVNYQANTLLGWRDKENGASWYQQYKPFILWKVDMFGGGRTEYTSIPQGCNFPSSAKGSLLNNLINSKITLKTQTSTSNNDLDFYKTRNFIGTYVPISSSNVNFVNYNGQTGYCLNRQVFSITTAQTNGGTYQIVDLNFNNRLASSVTCCPGEKEPNKVCNDNFQWDIIEEAQCSLFKPCAGADWSPSGSKTLLRYNCIEGKCISETKTVQCTSNADCGLNQVCDTKSYECIDVKSGEVIVNPPSIPNQDLECSWYQDKLPAGTIEDCGFLGLKGLIGRCEIKTYEASCKTSTGVLWIIGGIVILGLGAIAFTTKPKKRKRK